MKTRAKSSPLPNRKEVAKRKIHLNTTFDNAIQVIAGIKKPTKGILKEV